MPDFKYPALVGQFSKLHPHVVACILELERYCESVGYHKPFLTHILRTRAEQADIYWRAELKAGAKDEVEARARASQRWSWHLVYSAVDLRDYVYTKQQVEDILAWVRAWVKQFPGTNWEILYHDVGRGNHMHIGIRDHRWAAANKVT